MSYPCADTSEIPNWPHIVIYWHQVLDRGIYTGNVHPSPRRIGGVSDSLAFKQIGGLWGKTHTNDVEKETDINDIMVCQISIHLFDDLKQVLNKYKGGNALTHKTISYLHDRARWVQVHLFVH